MKKLHLWWKSLSRREKTMAVLIVVLLAGIALRWDNVREKATLWFRADEIMEEKMRATAPPAEPAGNFDSDTPAPDGNLDSDTTSSPTPADVCPASCSADHSAHRPADQPSE